MRLKRQVRRGTSFRPMSLSSDCVRQCHQKWHSCRRSNCQTAQRMSRVLPANLPCMKVHSPRRRILQGRCFGQIICALGHNQNRTFQHWQNTADSLCIAYPGASSLFTFVTFLVHKFQINFQNETKKSTAPGMLGSFWAFTKVQRILYSHRTKRRWMWSVMGHAPWLPPSNVGSTEHAANKPRSDRRKPAWYKSSKPQKVYKPTKTTPECENVQVELFVLGCCVKILRYFSDKGAFVWRNQLAEATVVIWRNIARGN